MRIWIRSTRRLCTPSLPHRTESIKRLRPALRTAVGDAFLQDLVRGAIGVEPFRRYGDEERVPVEANNPVSHPGLRVHQIVCRPERYVPHRFASCDIGGVLGD